jgi:hypothetical protein
VRLDRSRRREASVLGFLAQELLAEIPSIMGGALFLTALVTCVCIARAFAVAAPDAVLSKMHQTSFATAPRICAANSATNAQS